MQAGELKDKLLRTLADMENLRERTSRVTSETKQFAVQVRPLAAWWGGLGVQVQCMGSTRLLHTSLHCIAFTPEQRCQSYWLQSISVSERAHSAHGHRPPAARPGEQPAGRGGHPGAPLTVDRCPAALPTCHRAW